MLQNSGILESNNSGISRRRREGANHISSINDLNRSSFETRRGSESGCGRLCVAPFKVESESSSDLGADN